MNASVKGALKRVVTASSPLLRLVSRLSPPLPRVLVYHRFAPPGETVPHRVSADRFAWQLETICRSFPVISLAECLRHHAAQGQWPKRAVVLTIDDGYRDAYLWAFPELVKRRLTATFFVTTCFVDGTIWLWPDRLQYALQHTRLTECTIPVAEVAHRLPLSNDSERFRAWKLFSDHCIGLSDGRRVAFIALVEERLGVAVPSTPPEEYAALSWEELREMAQAGIEIGGHTLHHPILSRIPPEQLQPEIGGCRAILEKRLGTPVTSFCYPNSAPGDINAQVVAAVVEGGYSGAVFGTDLSEWDPYRLPRIGVNQESSDFLWKLYGGEALGRWSS